ncbi:MAG: extracellular solute-binding protein [Oscillospiraceae bacterium]|nr:extracellular solute-binding protein [Oscillospiraceae bacterium]
MSKKIICLIITAAILTSVFSCSQKTNGNQNGTSQNPGETIAADTSAASTTEKILPDLPDSNFNGYEFKIYSKGPAYNEWASQDISASEETGEPINDAVYKRNNYVEDKLNIKITEVPSTSGDMVSPVKKSVAAGDNSYDAVVPNMFDQATLAASGNLTDLKQVPYINLSQPWWDQKANADLTIGGKLFFTVGDLFIMDNDATWLVIFNKKLIADLALETPYDIVKNGKWTFDKLIEMCKGVSKDLNGDGKMDENDFYGNVSQGENMTAFYLAAQEKIANKDANDLPYTEMDTDRSESVIAKIYDLMYDNNTSYNYWDIKAIGDLQPFQVCQKVFEDDRALFYITALQIVIRMRNMQTNFGIVPMPKFDANQQDYAHYVHPTASALSIPVSNHGLDRTGIILEALSAESRYTVRPAYYDISINGKFLRDEESIGMLDIILATRVFDLATMFNWKGLGTILEDMYRTKSRDFVSTYDKKKDSFDTAISKTVEEFQKLG